MTEKSCEIVLKDWYDNYTDPSLSTFIAFKDETNQEITESLGSSIIEPTVFEKFLADVENLKQSATHKDAIIVLSYAKKGETYILLEKGDTNRNLIAINLDHVVSYTLLGKLRLRTTFASDSKKFSIASSSVFDTINNYLQKIKEDD